MEELVRSKLAAAESDELSSTAERDKLLPANLRVSNKFLLQLGLLRHNLGIMRTFVEDVAERMTSLRFRRDALPHLDNLITKVLKNIPPLSDENEEKEREEKESKENEREEKESEDKEGEEIEEKEREEKESEQKNSEEKEREGKNRKEKERKEKGEENEREEKNIKEKESEEKEREEKEREEKNLKDKEREEKESEEKEKESQEKESGEKEREEIKETEIKETEIKEKNCKEKEGKSAVENYLALEVDFTYPMDSPYCKRFGVTRAFLVGLKDCVEPPACTGNIPNGLILELEAFHIRYGTVHVVSKCLQHLCPTLGLSTYQLSKSVKKLRQQKDKLAKTKTRIGVELYGNFLDAPFSCVPPVKRVKPDPCIEEVARLKDETRRLSDQLRRKDKLLKDLQAKMNVLRQAGATKTHRIKELTRLLQDATREQDGSNQSTTRTVVVQSGEKIKSVIDKLVLRAQSERTPGIKGSPCSMPTTTPANIQTSQQSIRSSSKLAKSQTAKPISVQPGTVLDLSSSSNVFAGPKKTSQSSKHCSPKIAKSHAVNQISIQPGTNLDLSSSGNIFSGPKKTSQSSKHCSPKIAKSHAVYQISIQPGTVLDLSSSGNVLSGPKKTSQSPKHSSPKVAKSQVDNQISVQPDSILDLSVSSARNICSGLQPSPVMYSNTVKNPKIRARPLTSHTSNSDSDTSRSLHNKEVLKFSDALHFSETVCDSQNTAQSLTLFTSDSSDTSKNLHNKEVTTVSDASHFNATSNDPKNTAQSLTSETVFDSQNTAQSLTLYTSDSSDSSRNRHNIEVSTVSDASNFNTTANHKNDTAQSLTLYTSNSDSDVNRNHHNPEAYKFSDISPVSDTVGDPQNRAQCLILYTLDSSANSGSVSKFTGKDTGAKRKLEAEEEEEDEESAKKRHKTQVA